MSRTTLQQKSLEELRELLNLPTNTITDISAVQADIDTLEATMATAQADITALRVHDRLHFVKRVLVYEEPDVWGTMRKVEPFKPTYFRRVDMARKLSLWSIYRSQQRGHRTQEDIRTMAHARGMQSHQDYAEAFEVLRWCD